MPLVDHNLFASILSELGSLACLSLLTAGLPVVNQVSVFLTLSGGTGILFDFFSLLRLFTIRIFVRTLSFSLALCLRSAFYKLIHRPQALQTIYIFLIISQFH